MSESGDQSPHLKRKRPFGKYQRLFTVFIFLTCYQLPFLASTLYLAYSIYTLDYQVWIIFGLISCIQYNIGKCQSYIDFVNKNVNPLLYFDSFERIYEQKVPEDQPSLFSFHPHGVFAYGLLANMNYNGNDAMSRMVGLGSRFILNMPITGLLLKLWGVQSVDSKNLVNLMQKRQNLGLLPGGFQQATLTTKKQMRIYIQNRKGFIKYALRHNYTIYPTIVLNQHQAFWTFDYLLSLRMLLNKIKIPGVLFMHPKTLLFYPPEVKFITIVGHGIRGKVHQPDEQPTQESIQLFHQLYVKEVKRIYSKYQHKNGDGNIPLVIY